MEHIKANIPHSREEYEIGAGEGCFFLVSEDVKAAYDKDEAGTVYTGILDNDSIYYPGLNHGAELPLEMRGNMRPVVPIEALAQWEAKPKEKIFKQYEEYLAGNRAAEDFTD